MYSQGSRTSVARYLWLKFLWNELTEVEMRLFLTLPETLNSEIKVATLRSILIKGKTEVRWRLTQCPFLETDEQISLESFQGFKRLDVEIYDLTRSLPKVPKFSGWIRSSSAKGSKRSLPKSSFDEVQDDDRDDYFDVQFDWYHYLTVEDFQPIPGRLM